tara:strand:- start:3644 stop:4096 length:453 start_codon:yes stop_codon:yes gene_type:complete
MVESMAFASSDISNTYFEIESKRTKNFLYSLLFDVTCRCNIFNNALNIVQKTIHSKNAKKSKRLLYILRKIQNENEAMIHHGFTFFALSIDEDVKNYVICHYHNDQRPKIVTFLEEHIVKRTHDLLNGKFRSFIEYVEEIRFHILVELGV